MKVLLDTHALIWALEDSENLSGSAREVIEDLDNQILVSATSAIEIAIKRSLGKLDAPHELREAIESAGFIAISVDFATARRLSTLPRHHRDPFDRLLIAQALAEDVAVVTRDTIFALYPVSTIW